LLPWSWSFLAYRDVPNLKQKAAALFRSLDRRGDFRIWDDEFDDLCEVLMHQFQAGFWRKAPLLQRSEGGAQARLQWPLESQGRPHCWETFCCQCARDEEGVS